MDVMRSSACGGHCSAVFVPCSRPIRLPAMARKRPRGEGLPAERYGRATKRTVCCKASGNRGQDRDLSAKAASMVVGDADEGFQFVEKKNVGSKFDKEIASIAVPTLLTALLFPVASSVDAAIVGKLGLAQLSGVGLAGLAVTIIQFVFQFLGQLATPVVAQAHARGDSKEVARTVVQNLSMAVAAGAVLGLGMCYGAEGIVANVMKPAAAVHPFAVEYLRVVALAAPASLVMLCLNGIYRGLQDTKSTLGASIASASVNLGLDCLFVFGFGWGVTGAGLATVFSLYAAAVFLFVKLLMKGYVKLADFATPPSTDGFLPFFVKGLALAVRSLIGYGLILMGTILMGRSGVVESAAFEIARQMVVLSITSYTSLENSTQALCAKYLGKNDIESARGVLFRVLRVGITASAIVAMLFLVFSKHLAGLYTTNSLVMDQLMQIAPMLFFFLPLDACAGIMDGALFASHQSNYVSAALIATSSIGICAMLYCWQANALSLLMTWAIIKVSFMGRGFFGFYKVFVSKNSPYKIAPQASSS
ncbi:hypothetical protein BSKO_09789 [Bryopsis sp. KO-2023]|nr:hypothetical protein BSKO_09789 [Bryopsis sp. KO-2023]